MTSSLSSPARASRRAPALANRPRCGPLRSATYHRLAAASPGFAASGIGFATVLPTHSSLLRRALWSLGAWAHR